MNEKYFEIKDTCRNGLIRHLEKVFSALPEIDNPKILDIGCGTGVPTLWIAKNYSGTITAIDTDKDSIEYLKKKINDNNLQDKITALKTSFFDFVSDPDRFDIILAEGFLNVVGFEVAFPKVGDNLKRKGYFVIHDEFKDHEKKLEFIHDNNCKLVYTLFLDENVWWNDYYKQLEFAINTMNREQIRNLFDSDLKEIELYKQDSSAFRSIYYLVEKL
jgi:cyclopropane fatty-acyl-phospholipid synthase-like methyltransferase